MNFNQYIDSYKVQHHYVWLLLQYANNTYNIDNIIYYVLNWVF